jgi:hypothetical protein
VNGAAQAVAPEPTLAEQIAAMQARHDAETDWVIKAAIATQLMELERAAGLVARRKQEETTSLLKAERKAAHETQRLAAWKALDPITRGLCNAVSIVVREAEERQQKPELREMSPARAVRIVAETVLAVVSAPAGEDPGPPPKWFMPPPEGL